MVFRSVRQVVSAGQWSFCCRGLSLAGHSGAEFLHPFGQLLLGGELVLCKLLGERGEPVLKCGGLGLLLCQCGIINLLVKRCRDHTGHVWGGDRRGLFLFLLMLPVPDNAARGGGPPVITAARMASCLRRVFRFYSDS